MIGKYDMTIGVENIILVGGSVNWQCNVLNCWCQEFSAIFLEAQSMEQKAVLTKTFNLSPK